MYEKEGTKAAIARDAACDASQLSLVDCLEVLLTSFDEFSIRESMFNAYQNRYRYRNRARELACRHAREQMQESVDARKFD